MQLVTAYYMIPSKQPHSVYMGNIKRFFDFVKQPVLFFTSRDLFSKLSPLAGKNIVFRIVEFKQLEVFKEFPPSFWETQISRDPELYHTWQLGAIWANKKYFVKEAAREYPDKDWFMWIDAGCVRKDTWKPFIDNFTNRNRVVEPGVYMQVLNGFPNDKKYFTYPAQHVAGALILFHKTCIEDYINDYNTIQREYDSEKIPGTMDQYIMASMLNKYPRWVGLERMKLAEFNYVNTCPDAWFFFMAVF